MWFPLPNNHDCAISPLIKLIFLFCLAQLRKETTLTCHKKREKFTIIQFAVEYFQVPKYNM